MRKAVTRHFINVKVPVLHRMGQLPRGAVNKYKLAQQIANKHSRHSVGGGGYGFGTSDYDISIYMPVTKLDAFKAELRANGIRFKDYGVTENY